jgi:hypothetical protein
MAGKFGLQVHFSKCFWFLSLVKDNQELLIGEILVRLKSENSCKLQRNLSVKLIPANPN